MPSSEKVFRTIIMATGSPWSGRVGDDFVNFLLLFSCKSTFSWSEGALQDEVRIEEGGGQDGFSCSNAGSLRFPGTLHRRHFRAPLASTREGSGLPANALHQWQSTPAPKATHRSRPHRQMTCALAAVDRIRRVGGGLGLFLPDHLGEMVLQLIFVVLSSPSQTVAAAREF